MWKPIAVSTFILGIALSSISAQAKGLQIDPPKCNQNYGSAMIENASSAIWIRAKGSHPERFISGMADVSNCFTMTKDKSAAKYILKAGTLSKEQFNQGASGFSNVDQIDSPRTAPKGKMRYGYLEIRHAKSGQLAGRGFGRNNTAGLDFSNWNIQGSTGMALTTDDTRLLTGSLVNAFFDFSQNPEKFNMDAKKVTSSTKTIAASPSAPIVHPKMPAPPVASSSKIVLPPKPPANWAKRSSVVIDASTAPSLDASLQSMIKPLAPKQQLQVMTDFFGYIEVTSCLDKGGIGDVIFVKVSKNGCYQRFQHHHNEAKAHMYIAERRMDTEQAYTATSLLSGTRKGGRTRTESFIYFIKQYGKYVDGMSVRDLSAKFESYRLGSSSATRSSKNDEAALLREEIARWETNMSYMPRRAGTKADLEKGQKDCLAFLDTAREQVSYLEGRASPPKKRLSSMVSTIHPCEMIQGRSRMEVLDPDIRNKMKNINSLSKEEKMDLMKRTMGINPKR